ncbi:cation-translocating P-type ATPase [Ethanoligenens harbinense]|uniref:ATPase, P-type (Transporting), HAD superfamily, subfamily IC n=1 Tax=Ethanoligenens harbinense (strain DSM 18485 / JCM 12961 / CGMCC 1.5033 / YUAN-3) TaxID=663278 RepID=E6U2Y4_ETHHY|nr:cation-translocating P-type ATPase [Ethanoligenens harbinense]ADU26351.1 ATPase, P-type (transporting), HAD superfamily, subfamily IC [Ethanoligenens harbinense YUAN-3]AVQ95482.1 cation-translocating P-type ATPase [Ethanoligenens harbinense YUAN-3]AYF38147.1 cation-translocating P-type ATPase [Ethanoligenens harbinense]AYF40892.1 cation-translocating P-type ATPase [Ethanoligenens harbinense]QCN91723.1 cation-translocating P-type ATPase [Ethanoligenens harbinense]
MTGSKYTAAGLTSAEARSLQERFGKNELVPQKNQDFFHKALHILSEPMFLLLIAAAAIYFILGEQRDGAVMLLFVVGMIGIDMTQEWKTDRTLRALRNLSAPRVTVLRDGKETEIASVDLVPGDVMLVHEGVKIPADGSIIRCSDLCVDESTLTGEAEGVWKVDRAHAEPPSGYWRKDYCYAGTLVTQGMAEILVKEIGAATEYGKISADVASAPPTASPLQKQTGSLVKLCAGIAAVLFALVCVVTYFSIPARAVGSRLIDSILAGVTLAMAMIPEEFPVILTVFLSMGAWRLAQKSSLVRKLPAVETLGAVSVLCVDKTGTITMNRMTVQETWSANGDEHALCEVMGLGCETDAYDPMEKAMLAHCEKLGITKEQLFGGELITEYAFTNEQKMMGHVWRRGREIVIAAKGSPERLITLCALSDDARQAAEQKSEEMSRRGLRVIAVGAAHPRTESEIPNRLADCALTFLGLVGLADPPRESVRKDIARCRKAGIRVVMITGDNGMTAAAIAEKVGMPHNGRMVTGDRLEAMTDGELQETVREVSIFSRVVPAHKMRIVKAFRENGEVVAMTGDGVNDAPALKYADIGIAMGKRGSEVSREAADLILMDDNFSTIVDTVEDGRRIYDNIRKAMGYVFTIHIPIALASLLAPMLSIPATGLLLLPLHVVLLELIIDPTCSVVLERQPAENDIMERRPRDPKGKLIGAGLLAKSILQGLAIFAASFGTYLTVLAQSPQNVPLARTMGLAIIMLANLFLVQVNSSEREPVFRSARRLAKDRVMWIANIAVLAGLFVILYTPLHGFLELSALSAAQFLMVVGISAVSVLWYEIWKGIQRVRGR